MQIHTFFWTSANKGTNCAKETTKSRNADRAKLSIDFHVTLIDYD